jgi:isoquinoline 1-oxidoreductase beta subunit
MRVHAWRGIGAGYNKFVSESFLDEVAAERGVDPLDFRLELTKDQPRAQAVIKAVAEMSNYKKKRPGRGLGIAFSDYHDTLTAGVAEVSVDKATGRSRSTIIGSQSTRASSSSRKTPRRRSKAPSSTGFPARCRRSCR